jgi:hypothetical protein
VHQEHAGDLIEARLVRDAAVSPQEWRAGDASQRAPVRTFAAAMQDGLRNLLSV